jgi:hypothetical protein
MDIPRRRFWVAVILIIPALVLIAWLVTAQLPRWTAPYSYWFAEDTPGVCAAVASLRINHALRANPSDAIGNEAAQARAEQVVADQYDDQALQVSEPLAVQDQRGAFYVITALLSDQPPEKAAVIYLDAATGDPRSVITATEDSAANCDFDIRAALVAAVKSPPLILLVAYILIAAGVLVARRLITARGKSE